MQPLARDGLTAAQVTALLHDDDLEVAAGCELLDLALNVREDISDDLEGGKVARNAHATIHGTCTLTLARTLKWGVDLVRPYMILTSGGLSVRFNVGVFCLTTPARRVGRFTEVAGFDRLMLLDRQVGADYTVAAGVTYRQALLDVFTAAGLSGALVEGSAADSTVPVARTWLLTADRAADPDQTDTPVTYLRIVNDLLRAINFRAVWCDENGLFRCQAYQAPSSLAAQFTFNADDLTSGIVGEDRTVIEDVWKTPNRWVFRWINAPTGTATADLTYEVPLPSSDPMSATNRGLTWTSVVDYEAASRAKLVSLGDRRVAADRSVTATYEVTVGPFPPAGHADIYRYIDSEAGVDRNVQLISFDLDLLGADTRMTWGAV